jgi:1-acyl-sn-glycerol-3-phosphate acyltransferase
MAQDQTTASFLLYAVARLLFVPYLKLTFRITVEGRANMPSRGPVVLLPKHQRWIDIPVVGFSVGSPLRYIAKKELFEFPPVRFVLKGLGGVPLDRGAPIKTLDSFRLLGRLLLAGERVVVFPEGTYYPGTMGRGKWRLIQWILEFQERNAALIPFLPMGIRYGEEGIRLSVDVRIGVPLYEENPSKAAPFTEKAMKELARLSGL